MPLYFNISKKKIIFAKYNITIKSAELDCFVLLLNILFSKYCWSSVQFSSAKCYYLCNVFFAQFRSTSFSNLFEA